MIEYFLYISVICCLNFENFCLRMYNERYKIIKGIESVFGIVTSVLILFIIYIIILITYVKNILLNIDNIDVDAFGLMKILSTNFKKVIDIQLNPKATAESLKMSSKQFWAIKKYSCGYYTREQLISIYTMLNDCDYHIGDQEDIKIELKTQTYHTSISQKK